MHRLEGLRWENNAAVFIMINNSGTITPIFKNINDLPVLKELERF
jgi:hypothetical protein